MDSKSVFYTRDRQHKVFRRDRAKKINVEHEDDCAIVLKISNNFSRMCKVEEPIVFPNEKIAFTRTNTNILTALNDKDIEKLYIKEPGIYNPINNVCPDYSILLDQGLEGMQNRINAELKKCKSDNEREFLEACNVAINAIDDLIDRYISEAQRVGNQIVAETLSVVPRHPATTLLQALQSIRIISSMFYLNGNYQIGFGRIDQYLYPFYISDKEKGIDDDTQLDIIKEFFLSLNRDSDLYFGVQQGDNGQSMMLGGRKKDGESAINQLTYMLLLASKELKLIDPKINLRIDKSTPNELIELGCELTKEGLGFPQYSNDDVVIPALQEHGYDYEDAVEYTVAACWEFIIPGKGLDIVNQSAVSFPFAVDYALEQVSYDDVDVKGFEELVKENISTQVERILKKRNLLYLPSPLLSMFFHGPIEKHMDITKCAKYRNRGIHGAGSSNAADAMYIIESLIKTDRKKLFEFRKSKRENFREDNNRLEEIKNAYPKVGNAEERVDYFLKILFDWFADACEKYSTCNCVIRPGSGSAQFYVLLANPGKIDLFEPVVGATIDGRFNGDPFSSSLSPAPNIKVRGLISTLKSFSVIDYLRVFNGGPITVELSPSVFYNSEGISKLANVIKYFVSIGNQQLQINVLDEKKLKDAMKHPEKHKNLIVRVWGWSGYFCELAPEFQRQIINRHKYGI